jgi:hypothetical protein
MRSVATGHTARAGQNSLSTGCGMPCDKILNHNIWLNFLLCVTIVCTSQYDERAKNVDSWYSIDPQADAPTVQDLTFLELGASFKQHQRVLLLSAAF